MNFYRHISGLFREKKFVCWAIQSALDKLKEGEKQYLTSAQMQVFNDGKLGSRLKNVRALTMLPRLMGGGVARGRE